MARCPKGKLIIDNFNPDVAFTEDERKVICQAIITHFATKSVKFGKELYQNIRATISERFPNENNVSVFYAMHDNIH